MPFSFPAASVGDTSTQNGRQYRYVGGNVWELVASTLSDPRWDLFLPAAPTGLTVTGGNAQASLSWTAPTGVIAQAPITDYSVQYKTSAASTWETFSRTASTTASQVVTGLTNGTAYVFRVATVNAVGTGTPTAASGSVTPVAGTPPNAPTSLAATAGNAQLALAWTAPSAPGTSAITGYSVEYTPSGGSAQTVSTGSTATSYTLTGLTNGTAYTVRVAGVSAAGTGAYSSTVSSTPSALSAPTAVRNLAAPTGDCGAVASWDAPSSDGGSAITGYRVVISGNPDLDNPGTTTQAASVRTKAISASYQLNFTVTVYAINAVGESPGAAVSGLTGNCS
jgi:predicted phage tail protein